MDAQSGMNDADRQTVIDKTVEFVKQQLNGAEGGHDWWHIYRVRTTAKNIAAQEKVDIFTVELGALLHDIADSKFHGGDENIGPLTACKFLASLDVDDKTVEHVGLIIANISFKGGKHEQTFRSPELDVIQDADRLDAMGAIGIARAFNFGGHVGRELYNPEIRPNLEMTKEEYKKADAPTLNHFYEKLLLLKDRMNTETGKNWRKDATRSWKDIWNDSIQNGQVKSYFDVSLTLSSQTFPSSRPNETCRTRAGI